MFSALLWTHTVIAVLLALCAIIFSWNATGRRVVNAVASLQFLVGLGIAGYMGANHMPLPPAIWWHLLIGLAIVTFFGVAMAAGKRAGRGGLVTAMSILGIVLTCFNLWLGSAMAR